VAIGTVGNKAGDAIKAIEDHAELIAFVYQTSAKDVQFAMSNNSWSTMPVTTKLELVAASVIGRTTGIQIDPAKFTFPATFNLSNAINNTSKLGAVLWGAHQIGLASARVGKLGEKILIGGAVGGIFDDPIATSTSLQSNIPTSNYSTGARNGLPVRMSVPWTGA